MEIFEWKIRNFSPTKFLLLQSLNGEKKDGVSWPPEVMRNLSINAFFFFFFFKKDSSRDEHIKVQSDIKNNFRRSPAFLRQQTD